MVARELQADVGIARPTTSECLRRAALVRRSKNNTGDLKNASSMVVPATPMGLDVGMGTAHLITPVGVRQGRPVRARFETGS